MHIKINKVFTGVNMYVSAVSFLDGRGWCVSSLRPCLWLLACCFGGH